MDIYYGLKRTTRIRTRIKIKANKAIKTITIATIVRESLVTVTNMIKVDVMTKFLFFFIF